PATYKLEFIDYFRGTYLAQHMPGYAVEPVPKRNRVRDIKKFPTSDTGASAHLSQYHRAAAIKLARSDVPRARWVDFLFAAQNAARIPRAGGVYCMVSHADVGGLTVHKILGYIGRTTNLQNRFQDYLAERADPKGRGPIREFLNEYPD